MLKQRIITALVLAIASILALFFASDFVWVGLMLALSVMAAWEWSGFAGLSRPLTRSIYALAVLGSSAIGIWFSNFNSMLLLTLFEVVVLTVFVVRFQRAKGQKNASSNWKILGLGLLFIDLFCVAMVEFRLLYSAELLLLSLFTIWAIDTGAYFSGRKFGRKKLAQYVSPGKTWEGVYGGVLLAFIVSFIGLYLLQPDLKWPMLAVSAVAAMIAMFSVMGDLFESVLKRQANLKDSGSILPGHGGVLDRIDSLLIAVPLFLLLWQLVVRQ